ncbi:MAG: DUF3368 domain-containing protein [Bacteroidota bacterium]
MWREAVEEGQGRPGEAEVKKAPEDGWIQVQPPKDGPLLRLLGGELDDGEAEGIALAVEVGAGLLLLDETQARKRAGLVGLRVTGTLGLLVRARKEGRIDRLRPVLDRLRRESLWIGDRLYRRALEGVGEEP